MMRLLTTFTMAQGQGLACGEGVLVAEGFERADIWVRSDGRVYWLDATVTECCCPSYVDRAATEAGSAVAGAETKKRAHWAALAERNGRRGTSMETFLRKMAGASSFGSGTRLDSLYVQMSVTMAKMNVAMVREALRYATGVRSLRARRGLIGARRAPAV